MQETPIRLTLKLLSIMTYRFLADIVTIVHLGFVIFAILGGLLVLQWPKVIWLHIPAALWAALIEFGGWICPLTPLENWLRIQGGDMGYSGGFAEHYLLPILYPAGLTRQTQDILGLIVLATNLMIYSYFFMRSIKHKPR